MNILLVGNGGRENCLAWKIVNSNSFINTDSKLYCTQGSPGINQFAEPVDINPTDIKSLTDFAIKKHINFAVAGPEIPLSLGIADEFEKSGIKIFGPSKAAAEIETSKIFAKDLMKKNNIPTANYEEFNYGNINEAKSYLNNCDFPLVIKADGLAAGKGVSIVKDKAEAEKVIDDFTKGKIFGEAGLKFIFEEFIEGEEVSVFVITDGENYKILPPSQDHKKVGEGDTGKNTGGMGAIAPVKKFLDEELKNKIEKKIIKPVLASLKNENRIFKGCLYCGLIINNNEPYVIEFNCRLGDPETQAVLPLIKSDFLELLMASSNNTIENYALEISDEFSACIVLASEGYPDQYKTGFEITGINDTEENCLIFHAGTKEENGKIFTTGGRVLNVVGISKTSLEDALKIAYERTGRIKFKNKYFRKDIGYRAVNG